MRGRGKAWSCHRHPAFPIHAFAVIFFLFVGFEFVFGVVEDVGVERGIGPFFTAFRMVSPNPLVVTHVSHASPSHVSFRSMCCLDPILFVSHERSWEWRSGRGGKPNPGWGEGGDGGGSGRLHFLTQATTLSSDGGRAASFVLVGFSGEKRGGGGGRRRGRRRRSGQARGGGRGRNRNRNRRRSRRRRRRRRRRSTTCLSWSARCIFRCGAVCHTSLHFPSATSSLSFHLSSRYYPLLFLFFLHHHHHHCLLLLRPVFVFFAKANDRSASCSSRGPGR